MIQFNSIQIQLKRNEMQICGWKYTCEYGVLKKIIKKA
jgi:hypothetical protein